MYTWRGQGRSSTHNPRSASFRSSAQTSGLKLELRHTLLYLSSNLDRVCARQMHIRLANILECKALFATPVYQAQM
jgi:hypothetical protein